MNKGMQLTVALIITVFSLGMTGLTLIYVPYVLVTSGNTPLAIVYTSWCLLGRMVLTRMKSTLDGYKK